MSAAPGKMPGGDFLKNLPDTGYRPWQQKAVKGREEPAPSPPAEGQATGGGAALMTLLQILLEADAPVPVDQFESLALQQGIAALDFYRALPTLVESQLATKDAAGFRITEGGKKIAVFAAS